MVGAKEVAARVGRSLGRLRVLSQPRGSRAVNPECLATSD